MSRAIAEHEVSHALAALVCIELRCPDRWEDTKITLSISATEGACLTEIGDVLASPGDHHLSEQVGAVSAVGPCSATPDPVALLKAENWDRLAEVGNLSPEDVALLARAEMPDLQLLAARVVVAVRCLRERLGQVGWQRLCRSCRDFSNQHLGALSAEELCPQSVIRQAVKEAHTELAPLLGAVSPGEAQVAAIVARTEAQAEAQAITEARRLSEERAEAMREKRLARKSQ